LAWPFKHYETLFQENNFGRYIMNSLIAAGGSAVISVVFGSLAAYSLSRVDFRGKSDLFFWIISTRMAPVVAVMVPLFAIFRSLDLVGTLPGLILAYTTFNLPFAIWILKGFFDNVPYGIEEAQMVDGATRFQAFTSILPLVAPGIGAFIVLCVLFAWNDFLFAAIIGSGGAKTLPVATRELVQPQNIQWGAIMAAGVVTTAPMMLLGLVIRKYLVTGLTMGAVKE
jgi:multiple sugar transport system permease protein